MKSNQTEQKNKRQPQFQLNKDALNRNLNQQTSKSFYFSNELSSKATTNDTDNVNQQKIQQENLNQNEKLQRQNQFDLLSKKNTFNVNSQDVVQRQQMDLQQNVNPQNETQLYMKSQNLSSNILMKIQKNQFRVMQEQEKNLFNQNRFRLYEMKYTKNIKQQKFDKKVFYRYLTSFLRQIDQRTIQTKDGTIRLTLLYQGQILKKGDFLIVLVNRVTDNQSQGIIKKTQYPGDFLKIMALIQNRNIQKRGIQRKKFIDRHNIYQRW